MIGQWVGLVSDPGGRPTNLHSIPWIMWTKVGNILFDNRHDRNSMLAPSLLLFQLWRRRASVITSNGWCIGLSSRFFCAPRRFQMFSSPGGCPFIMKSKSSSCCGSYLRTPKVGNLFGRIVSLAQKIPLVHIFRCGHASLHEDVSVRRSVLLSFVIILHFYHIFHSILNKMNL